MILTGKTLEHFKEWYKDFDKSGIKSMPYTTLKPYVCFLNIDFSMQYGVLVDFFDSLGIVIAIRNDFYENWRCLGYVNGYHLPDFSIGSETRDEARRKAIEKANELYNLLY